MKNGINTNDNTINDVKEELKAITKEKNEIIKKDNVLEEYRDMPREIKGFKVIGKIEIPKVGLNSYILAETNKKSLKASVTKLYGPEINKVGNQYSINFVYNYAKIEALVDKGDIETAILEASYILSTVKFNDNVIKLMLNEEYFTNKEEKYDVFTQKAEQQNDTFLKSID